MAFAQDSDLTSYAPEVFDQGVASWTDELAKAEQGKESPVIDKILDDEGIGDEEDADDDTGLENLKTLAGVVTTKDR